MPRWFFAVTLLLVTGLLSGCGQDEVRKEKAALASSSARLESRSSALDERESSLDQARDDSESESIAESESREVTESESQDKLDKQAESMSSQAESVSAAATSISENQINSPVQAVDWVKQQRGETDDQGKISWQAGATGEKDGQHYFAVQGQRDDHKNDGALDLLVLGSGEIVTRDSDAGQALVK
ncbi:hypothetical protein [Loigolactobacillus zhaoyuanensis]|uniref:Lipoprotein n=1 Tax=Loigolactobacillus zhaoyuanensis TaxID=2486017 RepID=A0ABW8UBL4_9LACO|nr:hypothetical protein [Loigolactobacillus zhaoyuanensis]